MAQLNPYLTFDGNCAEAITFYKECLGGELTIQKVGETAMAEQMPDAKERVMHASLIKNGIVLFASDMVGEAELVQGNTITLCLNCDSKEEIETLFSKLSEGGKVGHPLKDEFWGATYGDLTDKYGFRWMFNFQKSQA